MKKNRLLKWTAAAGGILTLIGLLASALSFPLANFDLSRLFSDGKKHELQTVPLSGKEFSQVELAISFYDIRVEACGKEGPQLTFPKDSDSLEYGIEDGRLSLRENRDGSQNGFYQWYRLFKIPIVENRVTLSLPEDFSGEVFVKNDFGSIEVQGLQALSSLDIRANNGSVSLSQLQVEKDLSFEGDFGSFRLLSSKVGGALTVENDNGSVTIKETSFSEGDISLSFGSLTLGGKETETGCKSLSTSVKNGSTTLSRVTAEQDLSVSSQFGSIRLSQVFSERLMLENKNGQISGTIRGKEEDFQVEASTEFGSCSLSARSQGRYFLKARNEFGDIRLSFLEDSDS